MWLRGRRERALVSGFRRIICSAVSTLEIRLRWVSITPLGSPVVPEVYMISARS